MLLLRLPGEPGVAKFHGDKNNKHEIYPVGNAAHAAFPARDHSQQLVTFLDLVSIWDRAEMDNPHLPSGEI
jgi:hypothetical protein